MLNEYAHYKWPNKYRSDFAVQVTSSVANSQRMTVDFSNDKLLGTSKWTENDDNLNEYKTSRARVCVTVGMMTTGWDCPNILNLALMRPIFSPTEFIQIKGRGTRINTFECNTPDGKISHHKKTFKLFDFFAIYEYFEEKYNYNQVIDLPRSNEEGRGSGPDEIIITPRDGFIYGENDFIKTWQENAIAVEGMKIDNKFFQSFEATLREDAEISQAVQEGNIETAVSLTHEKFINKTEEQYTVEKLTKALKIDRKVSLREIIEKIFHDAPIKQKDELITEEFEKFLSTVDVSEISDAQALRYFFATYLTNAELRRIIDQKEITELYSNPAFGIDDYRRIPDKMREKIPAYIKTYIPTDLFIAA
jgi:type I restriction enzyme R subunit